MAYVPREDPPGENPPINDPNAADSEGDVHLRGDGAPEGGAGRAGGAPEGGVHVRGHGAHEGAVGGEEEDQDGTARMERLSRAGTPTFYKDINNPLYTDAMLTEEFRKQEDRFWRGQSDIKKQLRQLSDVLSGYLKEGTEEPQEGALLSRHHYVEVTKRYKHLQDDLVKMQIFDDRLTVLASRLAERLENAQTVHVEFLRLATQFEKSGSIVQELISLYDEEMMKKQKIADEAQLSQLRKTPTGTKLKRLKTSAQMTEAEAKLEEARRRADEMARQREERRKTYSIPSANTAFTVPWRETEEEAYEEDDLADFLHNPFGRTSGNVNAPQTTNEPTDASAALLSQLRRQQEEMAEAHRREMEALRTQVRHMASGSPSVASQAEDPPAPSWLRPLLQELKPHSCPTNEEDYKDDIRSLKFPVMEIPTFDGQVKNWQPFWDQFYALVHSRPRIPNMQKLCLLLKYIKPKSAAAETIQGFRQVADNYPHIVQRLKERYGNSHLVMTSLVQQLTHKRAASDAVEARRMIDFFWGFIRQLSQFGCDMEESTASKFLIIALMQGKLPTDITQKWEAHLELMNTDAIKRSVRDGPKTAQQEASAFAYRYFQPTPSEFLTYCERIIEAKYRAEVQFKEAQAQDNPNKRRQGNQTQGKKKTGGPAKETTTADNTPTALGLAAASTTATQPFKGKKKGKAKKNDDQTNKGQSFTAHADGCLFCGQAHYPGQCAAAKRQTLDERWWHVRHRAKNVELCYNCLNTGHQSDSCTKKPCSTNGCTVRHHPLLHRDKDGKSSSA
jgi:hypothetical protein